MRTGLKKWRDPSLHDLFLPPFTYLLCLLVEKCSTRLMMDRTFVIVTYCLAESFCFLIPATIIFNRFLKLDSTPTCSSKRIISEIIAFVAAEVLVCFFIIYYECQQPESGRTSIQPVAWLLASTLLIGLSTEVCNLLCSRIKESH